ncbi:MAG: formylglycine-generating enzyme family protein, partial [Planctomycetes bacterium]|nr:formylglycine-generating enzyme family protein [Planctomycetota bacterium]
PETPPEEGDDVPSTIRRAIEKAEQVGAKDSRFADPDSPDLWVAIPAGKFWMGAQPQPGRNHDPQAWRDEGPVHEVTLPAYRIGRYPVTVLEYARFVNNGGYNDQRFWTAGGFDQHKTPEDWNEQLRYPTRPVVSVSWYEACAYASWRGCRLPSEAEWERAARGPDGRRYPWGDEEPNPHLANYGIMIGSPTPVGVYPRGATPEQVHDLAGNVWEWCQDVYHESYNGAPSDGTAWSGDESPARVLRGGSWLNDPRLLRSACRLRNWPDFRFNYVGFRVASGTP